MSLAGIIFGMVLGNPAMGYFLAATSLVMSAIMIGRCLYSGCDTPAALSEPPAVSRMERPQVITSLEGDMVYCNMPYRLFLKESLKREVLSPMEMMTGEQGHFLKDALATLDRDSGQSRIIQLLSGEDETKYAEVTLSRKTGQEDFISWIFSGVTSELPGGHMRRSGHEFSLEQLGSFLDCGDCGLIAVSDEGQIIYANDMLLHWMTGRSVEDLRLPRPLSDFCAIAPKQLNGQIQVRTLSGEDILLEFLPFEAILGDHKDNDPPLAVADGPLRICQVFSCQSEVMANDTDTENINFDRFFRESPIGIAIVSEQGEVLERNHIFREYVLELDIKNTRSLQHIIDPEEYKEFYDQIKATLKTGLASSIADLGFKGKGEKHGQIYITRLNKFDDHDKVVILYLIDTTEQKNLELQFAQSQKMQAVGQLAGGIAHDFNNLLTAIIGFSDLLLVRHGPGDQSFSDIIQVKQNASRAANLVRQLLAFSRQQTLRPKVLMITDVLAELSNLLGRLIGDNIELEMKHGRDLGYVKADQGQMEQVIINLCVNARDAMDNHGKISIRTRNIALKESRVLSKRYQVMPPNDYVLLEVEDTGCGISSAHLGKIFEPFFTTKEVGKGTGLGLSTVYGIVKQTGGFIFPTSEIGRGTTFSIYLPVHKEVPKEAVEAKEPAPEKTTRDLTGKGTILLVEDEDAVRMFASRALKNKGYNVYEANSGEAALELFEKIEDELDLLISDVVMPIMDGPTLVRRIRETNHKLKVIFISGYAEDVFDKTPGEEDFHFLPKPFSLKQLAEQVKEILESA
ncbi:MAG: hybrid sensor histidine kinase/response regulator [Alphaproteobacteria bacterium]|nr:MAG: hybrid sensor histidine kinase/response regulator [Alphaproteobacteria bacterium]